MASKSPLKKKIEATIPAAGATANADQVVGETPVTGTVSSVSITPEAAVTGHDTNTRTFTLVNKGAAGSGTTVIGTLALVASNDLVAFDEKEFTLSAVEGATTVAKGDILAVVEAYAASGLAHSGGLVQVEIDRS